MPARARMAQPKLTSTRGCSCLSRPSKLGPHDNAPTASICSLSSVSIVGPRGSVKLPIFLLVVGLLALRLAVLKRRIPLGNCDRLRAGHDGVGVSLKGAHISWVLSSRSQMGLPPSADDPTNADARAAARAGPCFADRTSTRGAAWVHTYVRA